MNLGAEPGKVKALIALVLFGGGYSFYNNVLSGPDVPAGAQKAAARPAGQAAAPTAEQASTQQRLEQRKMMLGRQAVGDFKPSLKCPKGSVCADPMKVDPTLRLDLLAKLQNVTLDGGSRSLFEIGQPPAPKPTTPDPKIDPKKIAANAAAAAEAAKAAAAEAKPAAAPPPPPIPLKFYGFTSAKLNGVKRAFFLEGEEIYVVNEGDLIKRRYKIVRIQVNSVVVEDTQFKHQQTLPLEEPPVTG